MYARLVEAVDQGDLFVDPPSKSTFYRWLGKAEDLGYPPCHLRDWYDDDRSGRPRKEYDERLIDYLMQEIRISAYTSIADLHRMVKKKAKALGVDAPNYDWVKRFRNSIDPTDLVAYVHGRRAAQADATPKLTVPADFPNDVWTLDEKRAPVWIRAYHPTKQKYVAVKPHIILIVDNYSRAIVSYRVVPPFHQGTKVTWYKEDVLGTFLSGALKELAPPSTRDYAGFLPFVLRWDRHSTHRALTEAIDEDAQVHIPEVPGRQTWSQGRIERLIGTMKRLCHSIDGWEQKYVPASEVGEKPDKTRSKAATTTHRETTKMVLPTKELLNHRQFSEAFGEEVERYNRSVHSVTGITPEVSYFNALEPNKLRKGYEALVLLNWRSFRVSQKGITYRKRRYTVEAAGQQLLSNEKVQGKPDPLGRGIFIDLGDGWDFLEPMDDYARKVDYKKHVIDTNRQAKEASLEAREARQQRLEDRIGAAGMVEAEAEIEATLKGEEYEPNFEPLPEDDIKRAQPEQTSEAEAAATEDDAEEANLQVKGEAEDDEKKKPPRGLRSPSDRIKKAQ